MATKGYVAPLLPMHKMTSRLQALSIPHIADCRFLVIGRDHVVIKSRDVIPEHMCKVSSPWKRRSRVDQGKRRASRPYTTRHVCIARNTPTGGCTDHHILVDAGQVTVERECDIEIYFQM